MTFQLRASLAFTDSCPTIDPLAYDPEHEEPVKGDWHRFRRTMQGECSRSFRTPLLEWNKASAKARQLAEAVDELADTRFWFEVQVLEGLWEVLRRRQSGAEQTVEEGVLVVLLMVNQWGADKPVKRVYIDWLNSALYASNPDSLRSGIEKSLARCHSLAPRKALEAYAINTATGNRRRLEVDSDEFLTDNPPAIA